MSLRKRITKFKIKTFTELIQKGGTVIDNDKWIEERKTICAACPNFKQVEPVPTVLMLGCKLCGCPFDTKGKMDTFFNPKKLKTENTACDAGKWEQVDNKYRNDKKYKLEIAARR